MDAHRACIADVSQALECGAFAQGERFDNVQVLYIVSKGTDVWGWVNWGTGELYDCFEKIVSGRRIEITFGIHHSHQLVCSFSSVQKMFMFR